MRTRRWVGPARVGLRLQHSQLDFATAKPFGRALKQCQQREEREGEQKGGGGGGLLPYLCLAAWHPLPCRWSWHPSPKIIMYTFHMLATCDCNWGKVKAKPATATATEPQPKLKAKANAKTTLHTLAQGAHCCYPCSLCLPLSSCLPPVACQCCLPLLLLLLLLLSLFSAGFCANEFVYFVKCQLLLGYSYSRSCCWWRGRRR